MSAPLSARRLAHAPIALVTGASAKAGMGRASAVLLARHGAKVVVTDLPAMEARGAETVEQIEKEGGKATWLPLDVAREGDWEAAIAATEKKWGPLDILVSNAGIGTNGDCHFNSFADSSGMLTNPLSGLLGLAGLVV